MANHKLQVPLTPSLVVPDEFLAGIIGQAPRTWHEVICDVLRHLEEEGLVNDDDLVVAHPRLAPLFGEDARLTAADLGARLAEHVTDTGEPVNTEPQTYLLTWNPKRFHWGDIAQTAAEIRADGSGLFDWSCGRSKRILPGDRVFLLRQGVEPKGIIASGVAVTGVLEAPHWDAEKAAEGRLKRAVQVDWEVLLVPDAQPPLSRKTLGEHLPDVTWDTQSSGIAVPAAAANALETLWADHLVTLGYELPSEVRLDALPEEVDPGAEYIEGATMEVTINAHERNPVARQACLDHHGLECCVCGETLEQRYGELGVGVVHVHHLRPLSEIDADYVVDPVEDLRPICPNCHAVVHSESPALSIDAVRAALQERSIPDPGLDRP